MTLLSISANLHYFIDRWTGLPLFLRPSEEIAPEGELLASPQHERELSVEVEGTEGAGTSQEEAAAEGELAAPKKRAKKSGPTVEMCGMKARNVQVGGGDSVSLWMVRLSSSTARTALVKLVLTWRWTCGVGRIWLRKV